MKFIYLSINKRYYIEKYINLIYNHLFCSNLTCYCVNMVSVTSVSCYITSVSRYHPRNQSKSSMYISDQIHEIGRGSSDCFSTLLANSAEVKNAKIRNQYNQVPHLTWDTIRESDKNTRKHHSNTREPRCQPFPSRWRLKTNLHYFFFYWHQK